MDFLFQNAKYIVMNHLSHQPVFQTVRYWLVDHPIIVNFSWKQGETPASSLLFLTLTLLSYLFFTFFLSHVTKPNFSPKFVRNLTAVHDVVLLSLSYVMALGCSLSILILAPDIDYIVCFPKKTPPTGPLFFWAYIFYLSKIYEFMDTLLIILSNSIQRLTFLHLYHHSVVVVMCYISLNISQSMFQPVLVTNALVHVIVYFYYFLCALGKRPRWKKLVTDCQITQFFSSFAIMAWIFYYHFTGSGCSGIMGWCFDAVFITSLLFMFLDFHSKNYSKEKTKGN
ncbi:putative elongation of fatty acids protein DDB_G0272012 [Jatropha curcas]|uniref:putative elongation of fatty acids protein DDB_G0272012 n=1 Tax=Jatropha curcas TaxID=180498 RepID=UPI0005FB63C4|nr:putative elongation of fatty acids protein DDB_G0272012 [Jatropha curcas]